MNVVEHTLGLRSGNVRVVVQPPLPGGESFAACALVYGEITDDCMVRIHSRCLYGDVFGSLECDCGPQLERSVQLIERCGSGIIIYLEQEGRGAGLLAKAMAYRYSKSSGADTYSAYEALHLPLDDRSYDAAATLIQQLGLRKVTLLTNNPEKIEGLQRRGVAVRREPLCVAVSAPAVGYLESKRLHGHLLTRVEVATPSVPAGRAGGRHRARNDPLWIQKVLRAPVSSVSRLFAADTVRIVAPALARIDMAGGHGPWTERSPAVASHHSTQVEEPDDDADTVRLPRVMQSIAKRRKDLRVDVGRN